VLHLRYACDCGCRLVVANLQFLIGSQLTEASQWLFIGLKPSSLLPL
jgi:hypothetical protein